MFGLGGWELAVLVLMGLIFFGPKKLPQLMKQAGKIMREVKKASDEFQFSINRELEDDEYRRAHRRAKKKAQKLAKKKTGEGNGGSSTPETSGGTPEAGGGAGGPTAAPIAADAPANGPAAKSGQQ